MPLTTLDRLPESARLWIFAADRELNEADGARLLKETDAFLDEWTAHRAHLTAARDWRYGRFLFIAVDESDAGASGCSIDALVREVQRLERSFGVTLADRGPVLFRRDVAIERVSRGRFADLASAGEVSLDTPVFDNTLTTVGEVRAGRWETPARDAWHARAFFS